MNFIKKCSLLTAISLAFITSNPSYATAQTPEIFKAKAASLAPYQQRELQDEVFYFVLPDRFYNADTSNDLGAAADDKKRAASHGGLDTTHKGMYHGGDLAGLTEKLPYLDNMGVSAIWLTPVLRNRAMQAGTSGYHGYWILDFTEIDPHLGSNAELKNFIDQAHKRNIKVFFDIITNHTADVIKYKECHGEDGLGWIVDAAQGTDCPFISMAQMAEGNQYTTIIPKGDEALKSPAWLNDISMYHNQGDSFWHGESAVRGDFSGLDDLYTGNPTVVNGMIDIYKDIIEEFKPDGFRIDTVKHVNIEFWQLFSPALLKFAKEQGINNFTMFAEVYSYEPEILSRYSTEAKIPTVLDFAFQGAVTKALIEQQGTEVLAQLFAKDHFYQSNHKYIPNTNANSLVNFTGNHDMGRFAYGLSQSPHNYSEQEQIDRNLLANAMMFFSRGVPVIYYGDEQGFVGDGGDQASRQDMMPSLVDSYNDDDLLATDLTTADDNFDTNHLFYRSFAKYSQLYQQYPALRFGQQTVIYAEDKPGIFAITREIKSADNNELKSNGKYKAQKLMVVFNTAITTQKLSALGAKNNGTLVYRSTESSKANEIAPLSFAIYQM
ncbi:alpha-amylase family glycosyl hydrolase [Colwellia sp. E2M01]|uniref:alpha-amylase family glycosyl hydrolase n=1 Tax=Colwellia sp. E2M01 TaxID=2841561 RepID=UPI001C084A98|nr:alpha-amylase family glycosyl hydrolase [Colwellia sp. E2M01]MBU2870760.1 alpha-amylase [Colwellia sp. E2M01]